jgi:hypothetical protein
MLERRRGVGAYCETDELNYKCLGCFGSSVSFPVAWDSGLTFLKEPLLLHNAGVLPG